MLARTDISGPNLRQRLSDFSSKFFFCIKVSPRLKDWLQLVVRSKQFSRVQRKQLRTIKKKNIPDHYLLKYNGRLLDMYLRPYTGDIAMFYEIFWRKVYYLPGLNYSTFNCIIDAGGNVGMAASYFRSLAPQAKIFTIEPDPENFDVLLKNVRADINTNKTVPIQGAVAEKSCKLCLQSAHYSYNSKVLEEGEEKTVQAFTITELIQKFSIQKIDLIKIDIEDFEGNLFSDQTEWLHITQHLVLEIHSEKSFTVCNSVLQRYGFIVQKITGSKSIEGLYRADRPFSLISLSR